MSFSLELRIKSYELAFYIYLTDWRFPFFRKWRYKDSGWMGAALVLGPLELCVGKS